MWFCCFRVDWLSQFRLLHDIRGAPSDDEHSIAAYLMRTKDENGHPIPRVRVWSEMSMFFFAGNTAKLVLHSALVIATACTVACGVIHTCANYHFLHADVYMQM